jgi:hypothetical protein
MNENTNYAALVGPTTPTDYGITLAWAKLRNISQEQAAEEVALWLAEHDKEVLEMAVERVECAANDFWQRYGTVTEVGGSEAIPVRESIAAIRGEGA